MKEQGSVAGKYELSFSLLLLLLGFFGGAVFLHLLLLHPIALYGAERSEKFAMLQKNRYEFTSAAFGSSHVHLGFDPRSFDAALAGTPLATRSINLGLNGGAQVEQRVMAMEFLRHLPASPRGPCLILLEATAPPDFTLAYASNPRTINIYDGRARALAAAFPAPADTLLRTAHIRAVSYLTWLNHSINLGMLSNRIFRPALMQNRYAEETVDDRRGFDFGLSNASGRKQIQQVVASRPAVPAVVNGSLATGHLQLVENLHHGTNGNRVQFIWLIMPTFDDTTRMRLFPPSQHTSFGEVPVINLARPDLYPALYEPTLWVDAQHVTERGAELLTSYLAANLLELAGKHQLMTSCGR